MQNKECGIGPNYVADSASAKPSKPKKAPSSSKPKAKRAEAKRAEAKPSSGGNDMSSVFAKLRDCSSCTAAGYGWCPNLRKCGGFANKKCGIGERYVSADPPPRNGLWESKKARTERSQSEAPATADVPAAPAPPPATLLYAGPASPPPPSGKVKPTASFEITASGAATSTVASMSASHSASNGTGLLGEEELRQLPHDVLVKRVLDLQNVVESLI